MSVKIRCPLCDATNSVNERVLGKLIQCPACGGKIRLPSAEQITAVRSERAAVELFESRLEASLKKLKPIAPATSLMQPSTAQAFTDESRKAELSLDSALRWLSTNPSTPAQALEMDRRMQEEERELAAASVNFTRPKSPESQEMDMTPMVDVTFLLLIFFMVTASFVVQKSIQSPAEPKDEPSLTSVVEEEDSDTVFVQVDEFNAYNVIFGGVDTPVASKQDLIVLLSDIHSGGGRSEIPTKLVIDAHENCIHSAVVAALDAGREAQFESFQVRTVEEFD
jgi:biopolymer transport protein ExbD